MTLQRHSSGAAILETALAHEVAGISVVPVRNDGTKCPLGAWKQYQTERPDHSKLEGWFATRDAGIGVVTGTISGNLEMTEIEGRGADRIPELADIARNSELGPLWSKLCKIGRAHV